MEKFSLFLKENIRLVLGAAVVIFLLLLLLAFLFSRKSTKVTLNGQTFSVKVAKTDKEKQLGLSTTKKLDKNKGMLFLFDNADYYAFWMKNMKFPLDIIYISGGKVVYVVHNAPTPTGSSLPIYQPTQKADKVLEINSGLSNTYNIKTGTQVKIQGL
jgi:uncharacterized membrane protein (UPF0127 family)